MNNLLERNMKKGILLSILLICFYRYLPAQSLTTEFFVHSANHVGNFNSWNDFEKVIINIATNGERFLKDQAQNTAREMSRMANYNFKYTSTTIWVDELTREENSFIDLACKQIPSSPKTGSGWLVDIRGTPSIGRSVFYNIFLYADSDGKIYYRMLKSVNTVY